MNSRRDISMSPSRHMHCYSSSFAKRTASCNQCKTTGRLTPSPYATNTPSHSLQISYETSAMRTFTQNSTFNGGITMYAFVKAMKRKLPSKQDMDVLNVLYCIVDSQIHQ